MLMLQLIFRSIGFMRRYGALQDRRSFIVLDWHIDLMDVFFGNMGVRLCLFDFLVMLRLMMVFLR